jgi:hypothetical protein
MDSNRRTAMTAGILFIAATAASRLGTAVEGSGLPHPDLGEHEPGFRGWPPGAHRRLGIAAGNRLVGSRFRERKHVYVRAGEQHQIRRSGPTDAPSYIGLMSWK